MCWIFAEVEAEQRAQLIFRAELIDVSDLGNEGPQLLLAALWRQTNNPSKAILVNTRGLISFQEFDSGNAGSTLLVLGEAYLLIGQEAIDVP